MKICLSIYKANQALNYSISKNQKYPKSLYYFEEHNLFNFDEITYVLDKTKNLHNTKINIEKFTDYIINITEIEYLLKDLPNDINQKWKPIIESLKNKIDSNESLYFNNTSPQIRPESILNKNRYNYTTKT